MNDDASVRERHAAIDREFHERTAIDYDRVVHDPRRYPNDLLFAPLVARIPRGARMLDLGTGTGQMIERLGDRFDEVIGVDHSPAMLERARAATAGQKDSSIAFVEADVLEWSAQAGQGFDLITVSGMLHHLRPPDLPAILDNIRKRLNPGGRFLVAEPIDCPQLHRLPGWLDRWNRRSVAAHEAYSRPAEEPDEAPLPEELLERSLAEAGFKVETSRRSVEVFPKHLPPRLVDRAFIRFVQWRFRRTGYVLALLARPA
jgi:ubiquinone/menaquinone biosynthesis C-methylase UbiE